MLIIYMLEAHPTYAERTIYLLRRAYDRGDLLFTSHFALGEVMAGIAKSRGPNELTVVREKLKDMGFSFLPFDDEAVIPFSTLRTKGKAKIADAIHLACAASAGIDLFLTNDQQLMKLYVPGVQFIADFNTPML